MRSTRARVSIALLCVAFIAACSSDDNSVSDTSVADTAPPTAAATTAPTSPDTTTPTTTASAGENADPVLIEFDEFNFVTATTRYKAGTINFLVTNSSDTPHEFGITRGNSYEELPQKADGSIDEDALGDDLLGKTPVVDKILSPTREISFDLTPGNYVFFCNLVVGPVSHAARGQVLSVTVDG